jgi:4-amino-4-deoxy-L-arabinose transferase-like glycosyltransferase
MAARRTEGGSEESAFVAATIVATCYGYYAIARLALPDLVLTFCISLTVWATLEAFDSSDATPWWLTAGLAAGLGFLTKGPVALVLPALILLPVWWRQRREVRVPARGLLFAALTFAVIGLPWYAAMVAEHGTAYLRSFFLGDNLERFATATYNEPRPLWFYVPIVIGGLMPWSAYLIALPIRPGLDLLRRRRRLAFGEWRLLAWALMPLLFYTASIGKQPRYVLPVLPPLAILLARSLMARMQTGAASGRAPAIRIATWSTAALFLLLTVLLVRAQPLFISAYPPLTWFGVGAIAAAGAALAWVAFTSAWGRLPPVMTACAVVLLLTVQFGALAGIRPEPVERMAALVAAHRTADQPVGEYQVFVRNLVFYAGFEQTRLDDEASAIQFAQSGQPVLLVVRERDLPRIEAGAARQLRRLGEVRYLNTANLKVRTLLWPDPSRDVENVLLVTNR